MSKFDEVEALIGKHGFEGVMLAAFKRPPQPAEGYTRNVQPRGPVVRPEDAFPESCCEGAALNDGKDAE